MAEVAGLLYNSSGNVGCYNVTSLVGPAGPGATWEFQWCAQRAAQELPYFPATGRSDMFWYQGGLRTFSCTCLGLCCYSLPGLQASIMTRVSCLPVGTCAVKTVQDNA